MPEKSPLNWWERNVLWLVFTLLIAGWWGVLATLYKWTLDARVVWFATLNIVLTLRFVAGVANKRSANFQCVFFLVARITAVWFPVALASLVPLIFVGWFSTLWIHNALPFHLDPIRNMEWWATHASIVSIGTCAGALLTVFASRRRLMEVPEVP